ncbi:MAG: radical SAM protein [Clostridia bacterium]|nr:radical SAM protein [Clostridia bacterium]
MPNTDCFQSCNDRNRTCTVTVLGKPVTVKNYICSSDGVSYYKKDDDIKLSLAVCPIMFCPGRCPFCIAKNTDSNKRIDIERLSKVLYALKEENRIQRINITGGEPFYDVVFLNEVVNLIYEVFGFDFELSISTNGVHIERIFEISGLEHIEAIHISRHHYDDAINRTIFGGFNAPGKEKLKEAVDSVSFKDIFVYNCMLLKDFINSREDVHKMLDFAIETGVPKVGFMSCSPVNEYAAEQTVPFESVINDEDESLLFTRGFYDYEFCRCRDGVYLSEDGSIEEFYARSTNNDKCKYSRGLCFDADNHLRDGYGGNIIV